jgi:hypothetical protein
MAAKELKERKKAEAGVEGFKANQGDQSKIHVSLAEAAGEEKARGGSR